MAAKPGRMTADMKDIILQCACCHKEITDLSAAGDESHEPLNAKGCGGIIVDLVKKWDGIALPIRRRLERESKNRRLLAVLNA